MTPNTTDGALSLPFGGGEALLIREKLLPLLAKQAERYTMGESSSVPVETANELLASVLYCLGAGKHGARRLCRLSETDIGAQFERGLRIVGRKTDFAKRLWLRVCRSLPEPHSASMKDTLAELGRYLRLYDPQFFACALPSGIDYQLALPVPERFTGVDHAISYLLRLCTENSFLCALDRKELSALYRRCGEEFLDTPLNLYEPAAANAVGRALLGRGPETLSFSASERAQLCDMLRRMTRRELDSALKSSAARLISAQNGAGYLSECAARLAPRILAARDDSVLFGVFV